MPTSFFFYSVLEFLEVGEHFALLLDREDPRVPRVVVDEGDVVTTSSDGQSLSRCPYIRGCDVEEALAYGALLREWEWMLFAELRCFAHSVNSF